MAKPREGSEWISELDPSLVKLDRERWLQRTSLPGRLSALGWAVLQGFAGLSPCGMYPRTSARGIPPATQEKEA